MGPGRDGAFLGYFATAVEAAVCYARHLADSAAARQAATTDAHAPQAAAASAAAASAAAAAAAAAAGYDGTVHRPAMPAPPVASHPPLARLARGYP